jgi:hypothetical protein
MFKGVLCLRVTKLYIYLLELQNNFFFLLELRGKKYREVLSR